MKKAILFLSIFSITILATSQNKTVFTLSLKDGSVVTGTTKITNLLLVTDYGKLEVPIKNVTSTCR